MQIQKSLLERSRADVLPEKVSPNYSLCRDAPSGTSSGWGAGVPAQAWSGSLPALQHPWPRRGSLH